jgi:hypothetical protein
VASHGCGQASSSATLQSAPARRFVSIDGGDGCLLLNLNGTTAAASMRRKRVALDSGRIETDDGE